MSKDLKDVNKRLKAADSEIAKAEKVLEKARDKRAKIASAWRFKCRKCGLAFKPGEIAYTKWRARRTHQECQPMGDYDIWQVESYEFRGCCPKCGRDFGVKVQPDEYISETQRYGRWDDKPDWQPDSCNISDPKKRRVDKYMVKYMAETRYG